MPRLDVRPSQIPRPAGRHSLAVLGDTALLLLSQSPVAAQRLTLDGTPVGAPLAIADAAEGFSGWSGVTAGGSAWLVTYACDEGGRHTKYARIVSAAGVVGRRLTLADVTHEWPHSDRAGAAWAGDRWIVGTRRRLTGDLPTPVLHVVYPDGRVVTGPDLGDGADYYGSPDVAVSGDIGIVVGFRGSNGTYARRFNTTTLEPVGPMLELSDQSSRMEDQAVVATGDRFLVAWWRAGVVDLRVVQRDGTLGGRRSAYGPDAGDVVLVAHGTRPGALLTTRGPGAALCVAEVGVDGSPVSRLMPVAAWDGRWPAWQPSLAAVGEGWLVVGQQTDTGHQATVRVVGEPDYEEPVEPTPVPVPRIGRPLGVWWYEFATPPELPPGNGEIAVRRVEGRRPRPLIIGGETEALAEVPGNVILGYRSGSEPQFPGEVVTVDIMEARARALADRGFRPVMYWDARRWPRRPVLPNGSLVEFMAYRGVDEPLASFEADLRAALDEMAGWGYPLVMTCQCYTTNAAMTRDLASLPPVYARLALGYPQIAALSVFSDYGRRIGPGHGGWPEHPEAHPAWQALADGITGPAVLPPFPPGQEVPPMGDVYVGIIDYDRKVSRRDPKGMLVRFDVGSQHPITRVECRMEYDEPPIVVEFPVGRGSDGRYVRALAFKPVRTGAFHFVLTAQDATGAQGSARSATPVTVTEDPVGNGGGPPPPPPPPTPGEMPDHRAHVARRFADLGLRPKDTHDENRAQSYAFCQLMVRELNALDGGNRWGMLHKPGGNRWPPEPTDDSRSVDFICWLSAGDGPIPHVDILVDADGDDWIKDGRVRYAPSWDTSHGLVGRDRWRPA
jgi:hypothetical protein